MEHRGDAHDKQLRLEEEKLRNLIQEGLDSGPATPWTAADFARMRAQLMERARLEERLLEGLNSGDEREWREEYSAELRELVQERIARRAEQRKADGPSI